MEWIGRGAKMLVVVVADVERRCTKNPSHDTQTHTHITIGTINGVVHYKESISKLP